MIIPEKLKYNQFRFVKMPTNKEYFERFGQTGIGTSYSGLQEAEMPKSKIDMITAGDDFDQMKIWNEEEGRRIAEIEAKRKDPKS